MLVTTVEANPLRSLTRARVELEPGILSLVGPNGVGKTNLLRGALLRPHRALIPNRRPPRPDSLRRQLRAGRGDGPRRGRDRDDTCWLRSVAARDAATCSTAARPTRRHWLEAALRSPSSRPIVCPWSRARRRNAAPTSTASSLPAGRAAPTCASVSARRWRSATRWSPGSPPATAAPAQLDVWDATLAEASAALVAARAEAVAELAQPFAAGRRGARPRGRRDDRVRPAGGGHCRGDPRRPGRAPRRRPEPGAQLLGPAPGRAQDRSRLVDRCGASARRASSARRSWRCSSPSATPCSRRGGSRRCCCSTT